MPEAGLPPVAVQAKLYGEVPPVADAVQDTAVPTVPVDGQLIETARTCADVMLIVAELEAVFVFASVTVTLIVLVVMAVKVVENVASVAVELGTPFTDHA